MTPGEMAANPSPARDSASYPQENKKASHRTPRVPPLYIATPVVEMGATESHGDAVTAWPLVPAAPVGDMSDWEEF